MDVMEFNFRILALKKAAIVMDVLADSFEEQTTKKETKALAHAISWAVLYIETAQLKGSAQ